MTVVNMDNAPRRMKEIWEWVVAFDAYDYGDRQPLSTLLANVDQVPAEALPQLAKIVSGERKPNLKAAAKMKIAPSERMKIAASLSVVLGMADGIRLRGIAPDGFGGETSAIEAAADRDGEEAAKKVSYIHGMTRGLLERASTDLGVSTETIENLLRDLRKKIVQFPEI